MEPEAQRQIELLRRQFLQLQSPTSLAFPQAEVLKLPTSQARIYQSMFREGSLAYPPPVPYQLSVLKRLLSCLESAMDDPEEDVRMSLPAFHTADAV